MESNRIPLKAAISALRTELRDAARDAQGLAPGEVRFRVSAIDVELSVVAEASGTASTEIGWWIIKGKAELAAKDTATHKVTLRLNVGDLDIGAHDNTG